MAAKVSRKTPDIRRVELVQGGRYRARLRLSAMVAALMTVDQFKAALCTVGWAAVAVEQVSPNVVDVTATWRAADGHLSPPMGVVVQQIERVQ